MRQTGSADGYDFNLSSGRSFTDLVCGAAEAKRMFLIILYQCDALNSSQQRIYYLAARKVDVADAIYCGSTEMKETAGWSCFLGG
jgi:hypothetical protein